MKPLTELLLEPGVFSFGSALVLGAAHALTPGHGKTVVAAYLVGTRGNRFDALRLGLTVTAAHTASVFVLAILAFYLAENIDLRLVQPWIQALSGALVFCIGAWTLAQRFRQSAADAAVSVVPDHGHPHGVSLKALGISGGIVPCPEALALLLIALSRGQSIYGFLLLVAFSLGLAGVLVGIGWVAVTAGPKLRGEPTIARALPVMSPLVLMVMGVVLMLWKGE
jgi:ABC-type nickel/cobalt efflux system permease component RcnA